MVKTHKLYTLLEIIAAIKDLFTLLRMRTQEAYIFCVCQGCLCLLVREYHYILFVHVGKNMAAIWQSLR